MAYQEKQLQEISKQFQIYGEILHAEDRLAARRAPVLGRKSVENYQQGHTGDERNRYVLDSRRASSSHRLRRYRVGRSSEELVGDELGDVMRPADLTLVENLLRDREILDEYALHEISHDLGPGGRDVELFVDLQA